MSKLFDDLKDGLNEMIAHKKGKITLRSEIFEVPEPPIAYKPDRIKKIRTKASYSQSIFAKVLNVSVKTVQSWESGERVPSPVALRLLECVDKGFYRPQLVQKRR